MSFNSGSNKDCSQCGHGQSVLSCGACKEVLYCDKDCQKEHWKKSHKSACKMFTLQATGLSRIEQESARTLWTSKALEEVVRASLGSSAAAVSVALEAVVHLTDKDIIFCARGVELLRKALMLVSRSRSTSSHTSSPWLIHKSSIALPPK